MNEVLRKVFGIKSPSLETLRLGMERGAVVDLVADDAIAGEPVAGEGKRYYSPVTFHRWEEVRPGWYVDGTTIWD